MKQLPIHQISAQLRDALSFNQAVVIEGSTGCGKTTQIPQIIRDSGIISDDLLIGVTQPRRLAAISVAHRIAQERGGEVGGEVGYAIRFDDQTGPATRIKIMTDGLLLQEFRSDPELSRYGVIMVDEAHERSLNIDFTLGLLRELMDRRPELRIVISSATINPEVFMRFFGGAPKISVKAKIWPIEQVYRPVHGDSMEERVDATADVVERIHRREAPGDILVFLPGEGLIKKTLTELTQRRLRGMALLPLYGRLTREEQERVFDPFPGERKVVLSTNIAETSITIDGVRYVVDLGIAKVPSYDPRSGIPSLHEQPISRASAQQRAGRAGRTQPGVCYRLYDERDFRRRDEFATEEVLRMDLSEVVLRLIDLGIHKVESFAFVTQPPRRLLKGAVQQLFHMGAIDEERGLTAVGRRMVPFPLSPRLSRMVVAAADTAPDVLEEVLTVCALLSVRWPQVTPPGEEDEAHRAHRDFAHPLGDLIAALKMLDAYQQASDKAAFCEVHYLDPILITDLLRVRDQLREIADAVGVRGGRGGKPTDVVRCVAAAFSRSICRKLGGANSYETATGARVSLHPASILWHQARKPTFCVAADMVVTRRAWARAVSVLEPDQIIEVAPELAYEWRLRPQKRSRDGVAEDFPDPIELFGASYKVRFKKGRPMIALPWIALREHADPAEPLSAEQARLHVDVMVGDDRLIRHLPLGVAMAVAPLLRIDEPPIVGFPEGTLMTAERELHLILRGVPDLLRVARSRRRGKPAWLSLIPNGAGGYWFDAVSSLSMAVEQSRLALTMLGRELGLSDQDQAEVAAAEDRVCALEELLTPPNKKEPGGRGRRGRARR